jgi:apolipoprotein N-acyltransferase
VKLVAAAGASAVLYGLLFPPFGWTPLSWVALVPLFLAVRGASARAAGLAGGVFGFVATAFIVAWLVPTLHTHFERPVGWSVAFLAALSLAAMAPFTALAFAVFARARERMPRSCIPWLLVAAWVASELARTNLGVASPWTKLGDAHFASERLRQVAALAGVYGLSGLVALGNAVAAEVLVFARARWSRRRRVGGEWALASGLGGFSLLLGGFAFLLGAALVHGEARLALPLATGPGLDVAVVQPNDSPAMRWTRAGAARALRRYARLTRKALAESEDERPVLLVWPENALQVSLDDPVYGPPVRRIAGFTPVLFGAPRVEERDGTLHHFNSAFLLDGDAPVQHYDKRRLLPFSETKPLGAIGRLGRRGELDAEEYTPGDRPGLLTLRGERLGVLICMEALYPGLARELAASGARVLVNLSNDGWYLGQGGAEQHLAQVLFRAIETGLPVVRATTTGISAVIAPDGRILASLAEGTDGVLRLRVPQPSARATLYAQVGDVFALACAGGCLGAGLLPTGRLRRGRRSRIGGALRVA